MPVHEGPGVRWVVLGGEPPATVTPVWTNTPGYPAVIASVGPDGKAMVLRVVRNVTVSEVHLFPLLVSLFLLVLEAGLSWGVCVVGFG